MTDPMKVQVTAGAQRAYGLAQLVSKVFAETRVKGSTPGHAGYRVEMSGPAGPTTADTRRAVQYIRLVPLDGAGAVEMATFDPNGGSVELRSYDHLRSPEADPPVDRADYEALLTKVEQFFERQGMETKTVAARIPTPPPRASGGPAAAPKRPVLSIAIAAAVIVVVLILLALRGR